MVSEIAAMFSAKMQDLLNSIGTGGAGLVVPSDFNAVLSQEDMISCSITVTTVTEALSHLKMNKSDGTVLTCISNHFICASNRSEYLPK